MFYLFSLSENTKENNLLSSRNNLKVLGYAGKSETDIKNYIEQFFVGLLEGDGTITVDFISNRKKRVRIFIALKNLEDNRFMLNLIVKYVGGRVAIERNNKYVTWYATNRTDIAKVFAILAKYPLLSTRKQCQLDFAKDFIDSSLDISEEEFKKLRNEKYKNQKTMLDYYDKNFVIPRYFPAWLSGFIEAEGHFKLVKRANNSIHVSQFIIGQNYEKHLLKAILTYFNKENSNNISYTTSKEGVIYYKIHLGGLEVRNLLASHFNSYPLLGAKNTEFIRWNHQHENKDFVIAPVRCNNLIGGRINKREFSTLALADSQIKLNPYWITGFCDAESSFVITLQENVKYKTGWKVEARFQIGLHEKDLGILELIQSYFGVGTIVKQGKNNVEYRVSRSQDLSKILDHFDKYPLITQKNGDFILFKQAIALINNKEHLTTEGFKKLVAIRASLNLGLSEKLKKAFPTIVPVPRPLVVDQVIKDPYWVAGFVSGDGCFLIGIYKSPSAKRQETVGLVFKISQDSRDEQLMESLVSYFGAGNVYKDSGEVLSFKIAKFVDLTNIVIPFFDKFPIVGVKSKDFEDFKQVAELIKNKVHLTPEGLEKIRLIKAGINRGRK